MQTRHALTRAVALLAAAITTIALLATPAGAQDNSSIDQYIERVPDAKGGKPARERDGSGSGGSSSGGGDSGDSSGSAGSGSSGSSGSSSSGSSDDGKKGSKDDDSDATPGVGSGGPDGGSGGAGDSKLALDQVPAADTTEPSGGGPLVALIVLLVLGAAAGYAYWRLVWRRRGPSALE